MRGVQVIFHSAGIYSMEEVAEAAEQVFAEISRSIHDRPRPTCLVILVDKKSRPAQVKFLNGLADIMNVIIDVRPTNTMLNYNI